MQKAYMATLLEGLRARLTALLAPKQKKINKIAQIAK